ncbi:hypothetical protein J421_2702 [Gemmatirosa kalamazoonensis]|jgi:hypothetical protein|uniref:Lmo0937 family membrane protein n=1 Tax=Gemmatirosa kalamazoonensis TaxID=861299 RepID=W0RGN0_9BACT|nr:lmo0937 family membrane protein [Gemmatirosa kalamazoonensis]AHG90239.1 hypothetical protein J421_2702 [Gemmatirosa kalamazoonensis]
MDLWTVAALVLLVLWAVGTFALAAGGWIHVLLTVAVFVLIWRIVVRGTPTPPDSPPSATPRR